MARRSKIRRLRTVAQFHQEHDEFTQASLRWLIFQARRNGLQQAGAVVRVGRRVYLDPEQFFAWIEAQQQQTAQKALSPRFGAEETSVNSLSDSLEDVAAEIEVQLPAYADRSGELTDLVEKLHSTAEVMRDLETATQDEIYF